MYSNGSELSVQNYYIGNTSNTGNNSNTRNYILSVIQVIYKLTIVEKLILKQNLNTEYRIQSGDHQEWLIDKRTIR